MFNPIRLLKDLFVDFLIWSTGTYVGSPEPVPAKPASSQNSTASAQAESQ